MLTVRYRNAMSALPHKADMWSAIADVRFGPKADIRCLLRATAQNGMVRPLMTWFDYRERPKLHFGDQPQHSLLDSALASGLAVAGAGPVFIPSRTLVGEPNSPPVGRLSWQPLRYRCQQRPKADVCSA